MSRSGRSQRHVIDLANYLVEWTVGYHPEPLAREALHKPPLILPTVAEDPQPNPPTDPTGIHLVNRAYSPEKEIAAVVQAATTAVAHA